MYNNYFVIANAVVMLLSIITSSATASIGNSIVCDSKEKNYKDFNLFQFGFSMIMGWAAICILCLNQPFIKVWLGEKVMFSSSIAIVFAVFMYAKISSSVFMTYREAAGIWEHDKVRPFFEGILNLCLNIILVRIVGVVGVIVSTIITMGFIRTIWGSYYLFKEYFYDYSHKKYLLKLLHYLIITILAGAVSYFLCGLLPIEGILGLFLRLCICSTVTGTIYVLIYFKRQEFKACIGLIKGIFVRKK
jgi:O-antigen/teichoic acid export membrane protein